LQFWRLSIRGASTQPALCKYSCLQAGGDAMQDVKNYFTFCTSHTFTLVNWDGLGNNYQQTDTIDPDTFEPLTATVDEDPGNFNGGLPPTWNNLFGYDVSPGFVIGSAADWDPSGTRAGILAALNGVDWTALWAGSTNGNFQYDRWQVGFNAQGTLPANGAQSGAIVGTFPSMGDGSLISFSGGFGPHLIPATSGDFYLLDDGNTSVSDNLGISLSRVQIQIRNYPGTPIPYFIYETAPCFSGVTVLGGNTQRVPSSLQLAGGVSVYRKLTEGTWNHDRQIIQLPDAATDGPQTISTSFGDRVRSGTRVSMVVGMTFEDWMASILGPSWADYLF
jgi:hypothetical protein